MPSRAGAIFVLLSAIYGIGMVLLLSSKFNSHAIRKSGLGKSLATMFICGTVAGLLGIINLILIHRSNRSSATGQIVNLFQYHGKQNHSSFYVLREDRTWLKVNCDYAGTNLLPGEKVRVEVLDYQSTLLRLAVLDGQYAGWAHTEGDGTFGSEVAISAGWATALTAWVRRRFLRRATAKAITSRTD